MLMLMLAVAVAVGMSVLLMTSRHRLLGLEVCSIPSLRRCWPWMQWQHYQQEEDLLMCEAGLLDWSCVGG
jgi:hypothetical protein